jgi:protein-S-isoprenylcysteine O-methyltransferase Ste14
MSLIPAFEIGVWNAWILMIWLLILNLIIMLNKKLYQRLGGSSDTQPSQKDKVLLNLLPTLLLFLTIVYSIFLPLKLGTLWFVIGLVIFLLGLLIMMIVIIYFATTQMNELITRGVYRYSRHPGYVAQVLIYLGVSIASASWIFLLVTIIWQVLHSIAVKGEERDCLERYGLAYKEYMNRTPRWIGIPKTMKSK